MLLIFLRRAAYVVVASLLFTDIAQAEANQSTVLADIVVTPTRTSLNLDDVLAPVSVITSADIERQPVLSLQEVLRGQPSIQISNNGGLGKATDVFVRGANSDQVLVLLDGIRLGSSTSGTTAFQYLPINAIDSIEITRGPLSSLYGSEAIGGVIQIFTKRTRQDGLTIEADAASGSHATESISSRLGGRSNDLSFDVTASQLSSAGYPNCTGAPYISPSAPGGGCYVYDTADDGYHNVSGSARVRYDFSTDVDIEAILLRSQGSTRYAGADSNHEDFALQTASLATHWSINPSLQLSVQVGQSSDDERESLNGVFTQGGQFNTTRQSASLQADWQPTQKQTITLGADSLNDQIVSDVAYPVTDRHVTGIFAEYQVKSTLDNWALSVRHDQSTQFDGHTTGNAAWGHALSDSLKLTASVGNAFHAPSFDDLYYPNFGNANLKPESSRSADIGIDQRHGAIRLGLHAFATEMDNLIAYDGVSYAPVNIGQVGIRGIEAQTDISRADWRISANANWLDARNRTPDDSDYGHQLPRRARWTGHLALDRDLSPFRAGVTVDTASRRFDDLANIDILGGVVTTDLHLDWQVSQRWLVQVKLGNAFDRHYELASYYPQDGRNVMLSVRYRPGVWRAP